jgi:hypothetical protein
MNQVPFSLFAEPNKHPEPELIRFYLFGQCCAHGLTSTKCHVRKRLVKLNVNGGVVVSSLANCGPWEKGL